MRKTIWCLFLIALLNTPDCPAQEVGAQRVRAHAMTSLAQFESQASLRYTAEYRFQDARFRAQVDVLGDKIWQAYDGYYEGAATEAGVAEMQALRQASGTALQRIRAFDGKRTYDFNPLRLQLTVRDSSRLLADPAFNYLLPQYWTSINKSQVMTFRRLLAGEFGEPSVQDRGSGKWEFGFHGLAQGNSRAAYDSVRLVVDAGQACMVVEYEAGGGKLGKSFGQFTWAEKDGTWYVKHGKQGTGTDLRCEWHITELSWNPENPRARYDNLESMVPFGTETTIQDARGNARAVRYQGGARGKTEFELRTTAINQLRLGNSVIK